MNTARPKGTIVFTIRDACVARGIANPFQLQKASGLDYRTCYKFFHHKVTRVEDKTLAALCFALGVRFETPLMSYVPPRRKSGKAGRAASGKGAGTARKSVKKASKKKGRA